MNENLMYRYWGKAKKKEDKEKYPEGPDYHLLVYHCLDVAAVADVWLTQSRTLLNQIASQLGEPPETTRRILLFFILLHDLGKFDARFQNFVETIRVFLQGEEYEVDPDLVYYSHGSYGYLHFCRECWPCEAMRAVAGHHGYCDLSIEFHEPDADDELIELDKRARKEWIAFCLKFLELDEIPQVKEIPLLAGLCSVSDWLGSSITNFTTDPKLDPKFYYQDSLIRAEKVLEESGVISRIKGAGFGYLFPAYQPRGIQTLLSELPVKAGLTIVESDTGSGKTEFALSYASSLIQAGLADGIVFGLPTQATANGLFDRIGEAAQALFSDVYVTLAHSKAKYLIPDESGFLQQSNKRAFLGSMSVATIDQILMGVLGVRHQFVRSFGTRKSVLILDEIHSFDAYMYGLIEQVLKGQNQAFSSVILLSATLSNALKEVLVKPYSGKVFKNSYPLVSHTDLHGHTQEFDLDSEPKRKVINTEIWRSNNLLPDETQLKGLVSLAKKGAMVGVVCNTVGDAQLLYSRCEKFKGTIEIDLFHARFTFADRAKIELRVLDKYGKSASRSGRLLIATQVIEQSLDLDFDVLVSQIAPIEFLMQRMGRLWRHDRQNTELASRTASVEKARFITLMPEILEPSDATQQDWKTHYKGSGFVYANVRTLLRTERYLTGRNELVFPDCYRKAMAYVHHGESYDDEPEALKALVESYQCEQEGALYSARMNSNLDSKPLNDVDPRCALLTRDGEMSATVVLFNKEGQLLHGGEFTEQADRERSTVSIAKKHARGIKDEQYYCLKAEIGRDINYTHLGVINQNLDEFLV